MSGLAREVAIVGVGYSRLSRGDDPDPRDLTLEACSAALHDARVPASAIDGIFQYSHGTESPFTTQVQRLLGIENLAAHADLVRTGPSGLGAALAAVTAVASGVCETVLAYRTLPQRESSNARIGDTPREVGGWDQFSVPYGNGARILSQYAMKKRRRIVEFGHGAEEYGFVSVNARQWSALNERAMLREPITMDDYLSSPVIVDPLLRLDCDYPVNGSCAILVSTGQRARDLVTRPVYVDALAHGTGRGGDFYFADDFLFGGSIECSRRLWNCSSFRMKDVDLLALYDGFTHLPISWVEALGVCGRGQFADWVDGGRTIGPGGSMPMNTSGGMLAEGRVQGLGHLAESVLQLRGECGARQVPDARVAVVAAGGSNSCGVMLVHT